MRIFTVAVLSISLLALVSCSRKTSIKHFEFAQGGLSFVADISPSPLNDMEIYGRLIVKNTSTGFVRYGNHHLTLSAEEQKTVTRIHRAKTDGTDSASTISPMADERFLELAPGDSIIITTAWEFGKQVDFARTFFVFEYNDTLSKMPVAADTTAQDTTAPASPDSGHNKKP
jgi:hypothetical protein